MGWLRLVGFLKLQVAFAKEPYKRDYILQKRPVILRSLLIVATLSATYRGPNDSAIQRGPKESCHTMGWLRLVGSLKLLVSFGKEPYKRDDILQKRPIILRSLLIVASPYTKSDFLELLLVCVCVCVCMYVSLALSIRVCVCVYVCLVCVSFLQQNQGSLPSVVDGVCVCVFVCVHVSLSLSLSLSLSPSPGVCAYVCLPSPTTHRKTFQSCCRCVCVCVCVRVYVSSVCVFVCVWLSLSPSPSHSLAFFLFLSLSLICIVEST